MTVHEVTMKNLLLESHILFKEHEKLVNKTTMKVDVALNEVKELETLILTDNIVHCSKIIESIITLVKHYDTKAKMFALNEVTELKTLISTLLDEKQQPLFSKISLVEGVTKSDANSQQEGEGVVLLFTPLYSVKYGRRQKLRR